MSEKNGFQRSGKDKTNYLITSESVTKGHPDKICDQISDAILDAALEGDKLSRVACETFSTENFLLIGGEVKSATEIHYEEIAREVIKDIGYVDHSTRFSYDQVDMLCKIHTQSPDIAMGVDRDGAGDQGMMVGGAVRETFDFMPLPISMARSLTNRISEVVDAQKEKKILYPDGKAQVTIAYGKENKPLRVDTVVCSVMHDADTDIDDVRDFIKKEVIEPILSSYGFDISKVTNIYINPTGLFTVGGPAADCGLTGRKIIVDTYGGYFSHGGGAFSGKDPTKVDRSGAYMARYIAKNIVASGVADKIEVQLAYAIGVDKPVSVNIKAFGTAKFPLSLIAKAVYTYFNMTPKGIIETFKLTTPEFKYKDLAALGHFGNQDKIKRPWESCDKAGLIMKYCESNYRSKE